METSDSTNERRERSVSRLAAEFHDLRRLFYLATFALLVMGVGVNIYLGKQMRFARMKLAEQRQIVGRAADDFQSNSEPMVRDFAAAMQNFASTNKDFAPIFDRYRPAFSNYLSRSSSAAPPAR
jgi:chromosome condensin MukBEF complex kleisin-like MukF subunit